MVLWLFLLFDIFASLPAPFALASSPPTSEIFPSILFSVLRMVCSPSTSSSSPLSSFSPTPPSPLLLALAGSCAEISSVFLLTVWILGLFLCLWVTAAMMDLVFGSFLDAEES